MATHTYTEGRTGLRGRRYASTRSVAQSLAILISLAFIVVGVAGFIPSLTTHSTDLANSGPESGTMLFNLFQVSILHNIVHIAFGVIGLMAANGPRLAKTFLLLGGLAYLGLTAWGFMVDMASSDNVLPVNTNDNWLHLGLGAGMLLLGLMTLGGRRRNDAVVETRDDHREDGPRLPAENHRGYDETGMLVD